MDPAPPTNPIFRGETSQSIVQPGSQSAVLLKPICRFTVYQFHMRGR